MTPPSDDNLLARLAGRGDPANGADPWSTLAASKPQHEDPKEDEKLAALLDRINQMADTNAQQAAAAVPQDAGEQELAELANETSTFLPIEPESFRAAGLTESEVEALMLKYLLARGDSSGREIADQIKLPFVLLDELLRRSEERSALVHRGAAPMNDYRVSSSPTWVASARAA